MQWILLQFSVTTIKVVLHVILIELGTLVFQLNHILTMMICNCKFWTCNCIDTYLDYKIIKSNVNNLTHFGLIKEIMCLSKKNPTCNDYWPLCSSLIIWNFPTDFFVYSSFCVFQKLLRDTTKKIKHCLSAKASRVSMQTDKQDGKCLTECSNKVVLAYERLQGRGKVWNPEGGGCEYLIFDD